MIRVIIYNIQKKEVEEVKRIDKISGAVTSAILSIPEIEVRKEDISFSFPRDFIRRNILVVITGESFFKGKMNSSIQKVLCRRVTGALAPLLEMKRVDISVEIENPK